MSSSWDGRQYIYCVERGEGLDDMMLIFVSYLVVVLVYLALRYLFRVMRFQNPLRFIVANLAALLIMSGFGSLGFFERRW